MRKGNVVERASRLRRVGEPWRQAPEGPSLSSMNKGRRRMFMEKVRGSALKSNKIDKRIRKEAEEEDADERNNNNEIYHRVPGTIW